MQTKNSAQPSDTFSNTLNETRTSSSGGEHQLSILDLTRALSYGDQASVTHPPKIVSAASLPTRLKPIASYIPLTTVTRVDFDYSSLKPGPAKLARQAATTIRAHQRASMVEIGRELLKVKAALAHGEFIAWVEACLDFSRRTATNLMHLAQSFGEQAKWETVSHLPPAILYRLAAPSTPDSVRQTVLNTSKACRVQPNSVEHLLRETRRSAWAARKRNRKAKDQRPLSAYQLRKQRRELAQQQRADERRRLARDRAVQVARMIRDALGDTLPEVLAMMKTVDMFELRAALIDERG